MAGRRQASRSRGGRHRDSMTDGSYDSGSSYTEESEETEESDTDSEPRRRRGQPHRPPPTGPPGFYGQAAPPPPWAARFGAFGRGALLPPGAKFGPGQPDEASEATADTNATEIAARERARVLLLEFRDAKMSLAQALRECDERKEENERLNRVLFEQRKLFAKERADVARERDTFQRDREQLEAARAEVADLSASVVEASRSRAAAEESCRRARSDLDVRDRDMAELRRQRDSQESEIQVLREAVEAEKERAEDGVAAATTRLEHRQRELDEERAIVQQERARLHGVDQLRREAEDEVREQGTRIIQLNQEVAALSQELHHTRQGRDRLQEELESATLRADQLRRDFERERQKLKEREGEFARTFRDKDEQISRAVRERDEAAAKGQSDLTELKLQREAADRRAQLLERENSALDESLLGAKRLQQERDRQRQLEQQAHEERRDREQRDREDSLKRDHEHAVARLQRAHDDAAAENDRQRESMQRALEAAEQDASRLRDEIRSLRDQLSDTQDKGRQLQSAAQQARLQRQSEESGLRREVERAKQQLAEQTTRVEALERERDQLKKAAAKDERKAQQHRQKHEERSRAAHDELSQLQVRMQAICMDHEVALSAVEALKQEKADLRAQVGQAKEELREGKQQLSDAARERDDLQRRMDSDRGGKAATQEELTRLRRQLRDMERDQEVLRDRCREQEQARAELERQRDGLGNAVKEVTEKSHREQTETRKLLGAQEKQLQQERIRLQLASAELSKLRDERNRLGVHCEEIECRLAEQRRQGSPQPPPLTDQLELKEAELASMRKEVAALRAYADAIRQAPEVLPGRGDGGGAQTRSFRFDSEQSTSQASHTRPRSPAASRQNSGGLPSSSRATATTAQSRTPRNFGEGSAVDRWRGSLRQASRAVSPPAASARTTRTRHYDSGEGPVFVSGAAASLSAGRISPTASIPGVFAGQASPSPARPSSRPHRLDFGTPTAGPAAPDMDYEFGD